MPNLFNSGIRWRPWFALATMVFLVTGLLSTHPQFSPQPSLVAAQSGGTIDLAVKVPDVGYYGATNSSGTGNATGNSVAVGDISGDGVPDLVIGTPRERGPQADPTGRPGGGVVRVFLGPLTTNDQVDLQSRTAPITIFGPQTNDNFGAVVAIGDVNGDTKNDLIMQAPGGDFGSTRVDCGVIHVLFGPVQPQTRDLAQQSTQADLMILGTESNERVGSSFATGDFDNDGRTDLAIGSPVGTFGGQAPGGLVYILTGRPTLKGLIDLRQLADNGDRGFGSPTAGTQFAATVAFGDVDGDQRADLIVGAPRFDGASGSRPDSGAIFVFFNNRLENPFIAFGVDANDLLGSSLSVADVNGDRISDVIAGAPGSFSISNQRSGAGEIYLLTGGRFAPNQIRDLAVGGQGPEAIFFGGNAGDRLGFPYGITTGDVNGDGINDIMMSANGGDGPNNSRIDAGNVYIVQGSTSLSGSRDMGILSSSNLIVYGARSQDQIGSVVETGLPPVRSGNPLAIGDLNRDGKNDVIIGAPFSDGQLTTTRQDSGAVYVITQLGPPPPPNLPPTITPIANQVVAEGRSISLPVTTTDPNGDGIKLSLNGPSFVTLTDNGNGTGQILILPPVNTPKQVYNVVLSATDTANPPLTSSFPFTVTVTPVGPQINTVNYDGKFLLINGTKLSPSPTVRVNGTVVAAKLLKTQTDDLIKVKGSQSKLGLRPGNNTIVVIVNGVESNAAPLQL